MLGYLVMEEDDDGWFKPLKAFRSREEAREYATLRQETSDLNNWSLRFNCYLIELSNWCRK